jgi:hypothetical protein
MAYPEDHDENDLPPLPPAPEPEPLPAPLEEYQAEQQGLLEDLAEQLSTEDAAAQSPTAEVQGLKDLDLPAPDLLFPQPKRPTEKQRVAEKNRAHAEFLKQAETFTAAPAPPTAKSEAAPTPLTPQAQPGTADNVQAQQNLLASLEAMYSPANALKEGQTDYSREFQGEPGRDLGKQVFPQGDQQNDVASAEADLRSAQALYNAQHLELIGSMVAMLNDMAAEMARFRDRLNRSRH